MKKRMRKTVLPNGLTVVSEAHAGFQSVALGVWVKAGTRQETTIEAGAAHFLEHMLFKGTEKRSALEIAQEIDEVGGEFNAFTAREHTCFHLLLLAKDLELGAEILSDVVMHSQFANEEFERERKVILQEIAMVDESPEELVHDLYSENVYGKHGLGKPILGTSASIRNMSRKTLMGFFNRYYRPSNLIVSVAGDVDHERVVRAFKSMGRRTYPGREKPLSGGLTIHPEKPTHFPEKVWVKRETEQVHLVWGVEAPNAYSKDRFASFVLGTYLGGGMSSSLFQQIREKNGLAYTVYASFSPYIESGMLTVYAATQPSRAALCLKLIEEECSRLSKKPLSQRELDRIKENVKGTLLLASDSVESRMMSLGRNELYFGRAIPMQETVKGIDAITSEDLLRV